MNFSKAVFAFTILFVLSGFGPADPSKKDKSPDKERIRISKIKTQTISTYDYEFGCPKKTGMVTEKNKFDKNGNLTESVSFNKDGKMFEIVTYEYNSKNLLGAITYYKADGSADIIDTLEYNLKGDKLKETQYSGEGVVQNVEISRYSENGDLEESVYYSADGKVLWKSVFSYDKLERITAKTNLEIGGIIAEREIIRRDEMGNTIEYSKIGNDNSIIAKTVSRYNLEGKKTEEVNYNPNGTISTKDEFVYDDSKNMVEYIHHDNGLQQPIKSVAQFNKRGQLVNKGEFNSTGMISNKQTFEYDKNGNIIKWIKFDILNEPFELTEYTYEYYR